MMRNPFFNVVLSVLVNLLVCLASAIVFLAFQDWFGIGDISALAFWTIPVAIGLAVTGGSILEIYPTSRKQLRLLCSLVVAGLVSFGYVYVVFLIIGPWINAFSVPIPYLWFVSCLAQLLFLDRLLSIETKSKVSWRILLKLLLFPVTIFGTIVVLIGVSISISFLNRPEKKTFLIPDDFGGKVTIIFNEDCGDDPDYEDGRRLMMIPESGVLIIQHEFKAGILDYKYFFLDQNGKRKEIFNVDGQNSDVDGIFGGGSGTSSVSSASGDKAGELKRQMTYSYFYVHNTRSDKFTDLDSDTLYDLIELCQSKQGN